MIVQSKKLSVTWLFCLPALGILAVLVIYPLLRTFYYSFTNARLASLDHPAGLGFENYGTLFRDPDWWVSVRNTGVFACVSVLLETVCGLVTALLLNSGLRFRGLLRTAVLIPWAIPAVVSARIWAWMFNDIYGVVNEVIRAIGWGAGDIAWLAEDRLAILVLVLVDVWKTTPFMALLILAGLQSIPLSVHEAARVDGASGWEEFRRITLPLLRPALGVAILFRMLDALRIFDLPFVLTSNSRSTAVLSIYARQQMIDFQEVGYGSAASIVIFCATAMVAVFYLAGAKHQLGLSND